jgi:tetratricopeptide (TPR) repeat protein
MTRLVSSLSSQELLLESGRTSRPPLRTWARSLLDRLESGEASPASWSKVAVCMNNASLIEAFRGNSSGSQGLCELQLRCAENLLRFHDAATHADLVLQPWINLGRLLRIRGQYDRALEHFAVFLDVMQGRAPRLWPLQIDAPSWRKLATAQSETSVLPLLKAVYIVDSMKVYFSARDVEGAARFLRQARVLLDGETHLLLDEAELITLARLGRYEDALALTERSGWQQDGYSMLVRLTYRVALLSALGAEDSARPLASRLAERVLAMDWSHPKDQRLLRYLHSLGNITREVGLEDVAERLWSTGLSASHQFKDVPLQLSFLESLLDLPEVADRAALSAERSTLLEECLYVPLLASRGLQANPLALQDPIFARLRQQLEAVAARASPATTQPTAA